MKTLLLSLLLMVGLPAQAASFSHQPWQTLLDRHLVVQDKGRVTQVNYRTMAADRARLQQYLQALSAVEKEQFNRWPEAERLAFLINAYNAWTVELVLTRYPELDSIKDLGNWLKSPWQQDFIPLLGQTRSLDDIEHRLIREHFSEPRIHFAVNCASIGCPALAPQAYNAEQLEQQLEQATRLFLSDKSRNRLKDDRLQVSSIFKWYQDDFRTGQGNSHPPASFLARFDQELELTPGQQQALRDGRLPIEYLDYDWRLNEAP